VVQVVGGSMVFFKINPELRKKLAEKAKAEKEKVKKIHRTTSRSGQQATRTKQNAKRRNP